MNVRNTETDRKTMSILRKFFSEEELKVLIKNPSLIKDGVDVIKVALRG